MKPFARLFETILGLLKQSLKKKWHEGSFCRLDEACPFCHNVFRKSMYCSPCNVCLCPDLICSNHGNEGYFKYLLNKYHCNIRIKELDTKDLLEMQALFHNEIETLELELKS